MSSIHMKTPKGVPFQLGPWPSLYEPKTYKPKDKEQDKADKETKDEAKSKPKYVITFALDKERDASFIDDCLDSINDVMEEEGWSQRRRDGAGLCLLDADVDEVPESRDSQKFVTLAVKNPDLAGKYRLTLKSSRRPVVKYIDPESMRKGRPIIKDMPEPILEPDPDDEEEMARAERIREFWDDMVFEGQNMSVSFTLHTYVAGTNYGVTTSIDNILIVGGGTRRGPVRFDQDFTDEDFAQLLAWREAQDADKADKADRPAKRHAHQSKPEPESSDRPAKAETDDAEGNGPEDATPARPARRRRTPRREPDATDLF